MKSIIYVALGSAFGGVCRYLLQQAIQRRVLTNFPLGTLIVNITGCFVIGLVIALAAKTNTFITPELRIFLAVGVCGGYTTYSSFMMENYSLLQTGNQLNAILYTGLSLLVGFFATAAGTLCAKLF